MPGYKCSVKDCYSSELSDGITLHRFPNEGQELQKWIDFVGKPDFSPKVSSRICSLHFLDSEYTHRNGKKIIKQNAIPSVYLDDDGDAMLTSVTEGNQTYSNNPSTSR